MAETKVTTFWGAEAISKLLGTYKVPLGIPSLSTVAATIDQIKEYVINAIADASQTAKGLMSAEDKKKLDAYPEDPSSITPDCGTTDEWDTFVSTE